jgi:hypothetical protein
MSVETADRLYGLLDQATTVGAVAAVGLVALAGAYYQRAPGEVRARKSQRINLSPFVVIEDADQHS